jgi:hypothetical protein
MTRKATEVEVRALARRRAKLGDERLKVAAYLGHAAARSLIACEVDDREDLYGWAANLADHGAAAAVRAALALAELGRDRMGAAREDVDRARDVAAAWLACPCADHIALASGAWTSLPSHEWLRAGPAIATMTHTLPERNWNAAAAMKLGNAADALAKRTSAKRVRDAVRAALLPWALGQSDPARLDRRRVAALKREGAALRAAEAKSKRAEARRKKRTAPFGDSGARLTWSDERWTGSVKVARRAVEVTIVSDDLEPDVSIAKAWPVTEKLLAGETKLRRHAAAELLADHNASWRDGGRPIGRDALMKTMRLSGVTIYSDGSAEVFYEDGGLFWGHWIIVGTDERGRPDDACIGG